MARVSKIDAARVSDFLFRYTVARYRCVGGPVSSGRIRLAAEIRQGVEVFEGAILIDPDVLPPIVSDREYPSFFTAIINGEDRALPDIGPLELAQWRGYVFKQSAQPKRREPVAVSSSAPSDSERRGKYLIFQWVSELASWLFRLGREQPLADPRPR